MANVKIVVGANFGDEGKGLMTDYFCHAAIKKGEDCLVVCSNGGAQRGHTVNTPDGKRHVFHHFGSGTLVGTDTYLCSEYILNPMIFRQEYDELAEMGIAPRIYVNRKCLWTTPYDMMINQIIEEYRGENRHGSCGVGIWETIIRSNLLFLDVQAAYACDRNILKRILSTYRDDYMKFRFKELGLKDISDEWNEVIKSESLLERYIDDFYFMMSRVSVVDDEILKRYQTIVFENGQGLLLHQNAEEYGVHTTPSNTGIENPMYVMSGILENPDVEVCYVTRTYLTRHGAGKFEGECPVEEINPDIYDETNISNIHQGAIRYGKMDTQLLLNRISDDFIIADDDWKKSLAVTHMNETDGRFADVNQTLVNDVIKQLKFECCYESYGRTRNDVNKIIV